MNTARIINSTVERPKPTGQWRFEWSWRTGRQKTEVTAGYAADTAKEHETRDDDQDPREIPNYFTVTSDLPGKHTLRFTRHGAEQLAEAIKFALEWDGQ